jgi:hypothetical protein
MSMGTPLNSLPSNDGGEVQNMLNSISDNEQPPQQQQQPQQQQERQQQQQPTYVPNVERKEKFTPTITKRRNNMSNTDRILKEAKTPVIVALLFFILNMNFVDKKIGMTFVKLIDDSTGDLNYFGVGLKAVLFGVLYYVIKKFFT